MPTAKKTTTKKKTTAKKKAPAKAKRVAKRQERREKIRRLGRVIQAALKDAVDELPNSNQEQRRQWVVSILNKKLDLPIMNEDQEEILLGLLVDVVADLVVTTDNRGNLQRGALSTFLKLKENKDG
jgi:hypothetical protein